MALVRVTKTHGAKITKVPKHSEHIFVIGRHTRTVVKGELLYVDQYNRFKGKRPGFEYQANPDYLTNHIGTV